MAYYLDWLSVSNKRVEFSSNIELPADFELEIEVANLANSAFVVSGGNSSGGFELYRNGSGRLQVYASGSSVFSGGIPLSNGKGSPDVIKVTRDPLDLVTVMINGQQDGAAFALSGTLRVKTAGQRPGGSWFNNSDLALYYIEISKSGSLSNSYKKGNIQGVNDTTFPDTVGGNDGTLVNFPADNSQWVFYDDGSGGVLDISPSSVISEEVFGSSSVSPLGVILLPPSIGTEEAIGMPSVSSAGVDIQPVSVSSSEVLGELQVIPLGVNLSPNPITSQEVVQGPVVAVGLTVLSPDGVESGEFVPEPLLDLLLKQISASSVTDTFSVGRPVVVGGDRIVIPIIARTNFTKIQGYLKTLGFSGALEDTILAWLRSEGYEGQWNDAWYEYLEDLGHTGALPERLYRWKKG